MLATVDDLRSHEWLSERRGGNDQYESGAIESGDESI